MQGWPCRIWWEGGRGSGVTSSWGPSSLAMEMMHLEIVILMEVEMV